MKPKGKRPQPAFSGRDALAYSQPAAAGDDAPAKHHVQKRQRKDKGLEVVFSPASHKSYVTGFHKRKVQRRKDAQQQLEAKAKQQRLEDRKERREELRQRLQLDKVLAPELEAQAAERDALAAQQQAAPAAVDMFDCDGVTTTVTTILLHPDDELPANGAAASSEGGSSSDDSGDDAAAAVTAAAASGARPRRHAAHAEQQPDSDASGSDGFPMAAGPPLDADPVAAAEGVEGPADDPAQSAAAGGARIDRGVVLRPLRKEKRRRKRERLEKRRAKEEGRRTQQMAGGSGGGGRPGAPGGARGAKGTIAKGKGKKGAAKQGKGRDRKRQQ